MTKGRHIPSPTTSPNVKKLNLKADPILGAVDTMRRNLQALIEYNEFVATVRRESYLAHIAAGFTEEQALVLCKDIV